MKINVYLYYMCIAIASCVSLMELSGNMNLWLYMHGCELLMEEFLRDLCTCRYN